MSVMLKLFIFTTQMVFVFTELPEIHKCRIEDLACIKTVAQAAIPIFAMGLPEIGAEVLDPMKVDSIKVDLAGLKMNLDNVIVKGLRKAVIDKISIDMAKKQMLVSWDTDIHLKGHYKASGRLLILPISGDGDITIKLKKLHIDMTIVFDMAKNEEGNDVIKPKSYKYKFGVKENAHFTVTGLFQGNKVLSDTMVNFMNENWKLLANEFGNPMLEMPNKKIYESIKAYLSSQSVDDIIES